jgi:hypothetical protein
MIENLVLTQRGYIKNIINLNYKNFLIGRKKQKIGLYPKMIAKASCGGNSS